MSNAVIACYTIVAVCGFVWRDTASDLLALTPGFVMPPYFHVLSLWTFVGFHVFAIEAGDRAALCF